MASQGRLCGTRKSGVAGVPDVAAIIAWAAAMSIGPCSMSTIRKSKPARARSCIIGTLGIVTSTP